MAKVVDLRIGNKFAKGRSKKRPSWSVKVNSVTMATVYDYPLAEWMARAYYGDSRTVSVRDNTKGKVVAKFVYGREQ